jgi:hypothetical protein
MVGIMILIEDDRITRDGSKYIASCVSCNKVNAFSSRAAARSMLSRSTCRNCKEDYRVKRLKNPNIWKNEDGKWCTLCNSCGNEQCYTRMDHAKNSERSGWICRSCSAKNNAFSKNNSIGDKTRIFNRFQKSAKTRGIYWDITEEQMFEGYNGKCAMTGWDLSIGYYNCNASLDRIDSSIGYIVGNIQWVHTMVNMCKNKYDQSLFIEMCKSIAKNSVQKQKTPA